MEEKKFIDVRKEEYNIKQFIKRMFGKGKISKVKIEYFRLNSRSISTVEEVLSYLFLTFSTFEDRQK